MKVVLQVVQRASVTIDSEVVASIGKGYLLLVAFTEGDTLEIAKKMADKIVKSRLFPDENGKTNLSLSTIGGEILSVSQFTLYGSLKEGNRPSFVASMNQEQARPLYEAFYAYLYEIYPASSSGVFHADMKVELVNDGPFTLVLDSKELFAK